LAHSVSARKRIRQSAKHHAHNASIRSMFRTYVKKVVNAIESGDKNTAQQAYTAAVPVIDRIVNKGLIHPNKAARHKSRLNAKIKAMA